MAYMARVSISTNLKLISHRFRDIVLCSYGFYIDHIIVKSNFKKSSTLMLLC